MYDEIGTATTTGDTDAERVPVERLYRRVILAGEAGHPDAQRALAGFVAAAAQRGRHDWLDRNLAPRPGIAATFHICVYAKAAPEPSVVQTPSAAAAVRNAIFALENDQQRTIESIEVVSDDGLGLRRCVLLASHADGARILPPTPSSFLGPDTAVERASAEWLTVAAEARPAAETHSAALPNAGDAPTTRVEALRAGGVIEAEGYYTDALRARLDGMERNVDELLSSQRTLTQEFEHLRRRVVDGERDRVEFDDARHQATLSTLQRLADRIDEAQRRIERQLRSAPPSPETLSALRALSDRIDDLSVSVRRSATRDMTTDSELLNGSRNRSATHRAAAARRAERRNLNVGARPATPPIDPLVHSPAS